MSEHLTTQLTEALEASNINAPVQPLLAYLLLLIKWNKAYNLTAIREPSEMITKHLIDSLAVSPFIKGPRVLDVGTGAGFPGIPLAIQHPELSVVLLDSNGKKIRFLHEVKRQLQLSNIEIVETRAENYHPALGFDTLTCRAVSELANLVQWTEHLVNPDGQWVLMKGRYPDAELHALNRPYHVASYDVSGLIGERHCVIIQQEHKE